MRIGERIQIASEESDDPDFISRVERVVNGALATYQPFNAYLIKVRGWFDHKWLKFSGKVLGAVGVWKVDVTLPPFHPQKILKESLIIRSTEGWAEVDTTLHVYQASSDNLRRTLKKTNPTGLFMWFSGLTRKNGRGSVMSYFAGGEEIDAWYVGLERKPAGWKAIRHDGIHPRIFSAFFNSV